MSKAIITVGISCSGKTTYAKELCKGNGNWINCNRDDLRFSLTGTIGWSEYKFNKHIENTVTQLQCQVVNTAVQLGKNVIISDTNLNPKTRTVWKNTLEQAGFEVEMKTFPIDLMKAIERDSYRDNGVGYVVIHKQWKQWLDYINYKIYTPNRELDKAVIIDVDGTLAEMVCRSPYEWHRVGSDEVVSIIKDMVVGYHLLGYKIICMTGRDGCALEDTLEWLDKNSIPYDEIYIRPAGDSRKDSVVKAELFWNNIAKRYNVCAVVDDRPQVCRMWRDLGLKVIQVADPYKEF